MAIRVYKPNTAGRRNASVNLHSMGLLDCPAVVSVKVIWWLVAVAVKAYMLQPAPSPAP